MEEGKIPEKLRSILDKINLESSKNEPKQEERTEIKDDEIELIRKREEVKTMTVPIKFATKSWRIEGRIGLNARFTRTISSLSCVFI